MASVRGALTRGPISALRARTAALLLFLPACGSTSAGPGSTQSTLTQPTRGTHAQAGSLPSEPTPAHFRFGDTVCAAGDVNGDGTPDFVVGEGSERGLECWVLSGKDASELAVFCREWTSQNWGRIERGPDGDGDGKRDFIVYSMPLESSGMADLMLVSGSTCKDIWRARIAGPGYGRCVGVVHDADGDGVDEIGVLGPENAETRLRFVTFSGKSGDPIDSLTVEDRSRTQANDYSGECGFLEMADLDDDGVSDLAILVDGSMTEPASCTAWSRKRKVQLWSIDSPVTHGGTTGELALIGDLDQDGVEDLAVTFLNVVDVVSARKGALLFRIERSMRDHFWTRLGQRVRVVGDIDGDAVQDIVLSEPDEWWGGVLRAYSGRGGKPLWTKVAPFELELCSLGQSLAVLGDVDGDGIDDLVAGTPGPCTNAPGCAILFSGKTGTPMLEVRRGAQGLATQKPDPSLSWSGVIK